MAAVNSPPCGRGQLGQLAADYLVEAGPDVYRCNVVKLHYMGSPHDKLHFLLIARCSNVIAGRVNCARACVRAFVRSCVRAFVRSCVRAFVRSCVRALCTIFATWSRIRLQLVRLHLMLIILHLK